MSAEQNTVATTAEARVQEQPAGGDASLLKKINLSPVEQLSDISAWRDATDMAEAGANQRVTAVLGVFLEQLRQSGTQRSAAGSSAVPDLTRPGLLFRGRR